MRAAVYTRVSSEEQLDGYSLEAQADVVQRLCEFREWQIVAHYEERGRSGRSVFRPQFQAMIADAEAGKFDVIVVHKLDRFSRSLLDVLTYLNRLNKADVSFVSATEDFDFSTPFGKLILAVLGAFAQWYVDNLAAEVRKGKKQRAKSGGWNGPLSFGYTTPGRIRRNLIALGEAYNAGKIELEDYERKASLLEEALEKYGQLPSSAAVPCPLTMPGVILAFTLYATGHYSHVEIAWELNKAGYRTSGRRRLFSREPVRKMLANRFYLGETSYKEERLAGSHEPLISQELFDRVQAVTLARRSVTGNTSRYRQVRSYPLSGLLRCAECGHWWRGQPRSRVRFYRDPARDKGHACTQMPKSIQADKAELYILQALYDLRLSLPADWLVRAREMLLKQAEPQGTDSQAANQDSIRQTLERKLERARQLFMMGDISEAEYKRIRAETRASMPTNTEAPTMQDIRAGMERAARLLIDFDALLKAAQPDQRGELYRALFKTIYIKGGKIVAIEPTGILWTLLNCAIIGENTHTYPATIRPRTSSVGVMVAPGTLFSEVQELLAA